MNAFLRNPSPSQFSSCSSEDLHSALSKGVGSCIYNSPPRLFTDPICGNAFVEEGEECDCGSLSECADIDPCCEPGVCKLYQWAQCGSGDCCHNCSYSEQGLLCREVSGLLWYSFLLLCLVVKENSQFQILVMFVAQKCHLCHKWQRYSPLNVSLENAIWYTAITVN